MKNLGLAWRRPFHFRIPVRDVETWQRPDVVNSLVEALSFLSDDRYTFEFVPGRKPSGLAPYLDLHGDGPPGGFDPDRVALFSGGLDSLAGAAQTLGLTSVPVMVARGWSDGQKRAYVIADNKLALNAGWDEALLGVEIAGLKDLGFDLDLIGFSELELGSFLADRTDGLTDPDDVPAPPEQPVSEPGDVWLLGPHRLACGDSTDPSTVAKALNGIVRAVDTNQGRGTPIGSRNILSSAGWRKPKTRSRDPVAGERDDRRDAGA